MLKALRALSAAFLLLLSVHPARAQLTSCTPSLMGYRCIGWTWPTKDAGGVVEVGQTFAVVYQRADTLGATWDEMFRTVPKYHRGESIIWPFPEYLLGEIRPRRYYVELVDQFGNVSNPSNEVQFVP